MQETVVKQNIKSDISLKESDESIIEIQQGNWNEPILLEKRNIKMFIAQLILLDNENHDKTK